MTLQHARELRKNATDCERLLWFHLRAQRLQGFKFKRQQPIGAYIVDFVCFETRCIVEADGGQHAEQAEYDARRGGWLKSQGFTVLRFWNNEILGNTQGVLETIASVCCEVVVTPSPQPLSRQGRGAKKRDEIPTSSAESNSPQPLSHEERGAKKHDAIPASSGVPNSPLPSRERGRGRGGDSQ